jgi:DNA-binding MarR family transcriptional regulator
VTRRDDALHALASELWLIGRRVRRSHLQLVQEVAPELGINGYALLETLAVQPERRQSELAEAIGTDKPAMSRLVQELEAAGLVERSQDPSDGRAQLVRLTADGSERMARVLDRRRRVYEARLEDWPADDLVRLARELARYNAAWER